MFMIQQHPLLGGWVGGVGAELSQRDRKWPKVITPKHKQPVKKREGGGFMKILRESQGHFV